MTCLWFSGGGVVGQKKLFNPDAGQKREFLYPISLLMELVGFLFATIHAGYDQTCWEFKSSSRESQIHREMGTEGHES